MNEPPTITGTKGAVQQPGRYGVTESGIFFQPVYEGTMEHVKTLAAQYGAIGALYQVTELYGGRARLEVNLSWINSTAPEVPVNVWELNPQDAEKDLLHCDFPNPGTMGQISKANKLLIEEYLQDLTIKELVDPTTGTFTPPAFYADGTQDYAVSLFILMTAGVRAFPIEASSIRHTAIVSNRYTLKASFTNVARIFSTDSMIDIEGVPNDLLFDVPITPSPTQYIETEGDLQYGWRKVRPQVQKLARSKWQIVQVWQLGLWPVKLFGTVL